MKKLLSVFMLAVVIIACLCIGGCGNEDVDYSYDKMSKSTASATNTQTSTEITAKEMIAHTHVDLSELNNKIVTYKDKQGKVLASLKVNYIMDMSVVEPGAVTVTIGFMFEKVFDANGGTNDAGFVLRPWYKPNDMENEDYIEKTESVARYVAKNLSVGEGFVYQFVFTSEYRPGKDRYFKFVIEDFQE